MYRLITVFALLSCIITTGIAAGIPGAAAPMQGNSAPVISDFFTVTIHEDSSAGPISFTVSDAETPAADLLVTGESSDLSLVPLSGITFGGADSQRTITVTPAHDHYGTATISVTVSDGVLSTTKSFELNVTRVVEPVVNLSYTTGWESARLMWSPNMEPGFLKYYIYGGISPNPITLLDSTEAGNRFDTTRADSNLMPGHTYYVRVVVVDSLYQMSDFSTEVHYTVPIEPPWTFTNAATAVTSNSATLNGGVHARFIWTEAHFEYGTTTAYGTITPTMYADSVNNTWTDMSAGVTDLIPNQRYHYRIYATNRAGYLAGEDTTFTTSKIAAVVHTGTADSLTSISAVLHGSVNAQNDSTTVMFDYGLTAAYGSVIGGIPGMLTGPGSQNVRADLPGLLPNTTYHFRVVAVNSSGTVYGPDSAFTTLATAPFVATLHADSVNTTSARLNGSVNANGVSTAIGFEYGTSTAYGLEAPAVENPVTGSSVTPVHAMISGLSPNTVYHYRAVAVNNGGTSYGQDSIFMTHGLPPEAITLSPDSVTNEGAIFRASIDPAGSATSVMFEYGTTTAYGDTLPAPSPVNPTGFQSVSAKAAGLLPNSLYHVRVVATNPWGVASGADSTFSTTGQRPFVTTLHADSVNTVSTHVYGTVTANGSSTIARFDYGTTTAYTDSVTATGSPVTGFTAVPVDARLAGLLPNTHYYYRLRGTNAFGTAEGFDSSFTTHGLPPLVKLLGIDSITNSTAFVFGSAVAHNAGTTVTVEYGTTTSYGLTAPVQPDAIRGNGEQPFGGHLTGLTPNTLYHFRFIAVNEFGSVQTGDSTFLTSQIPPPPVPVLAGPVNGSTNEPVVIALHWHPAATAQNYRLQLAADTAFTVPVLDTLLTDTGFTAGPLSHMTTYYWHVRAINAGGPGAYSSHWSFTTLPQAPNSPVLTSPPDMALNTPLTMTLAWDSLPGVISYRVQVATDSLFTAIVADDSSLTTTTRTVGPLGYFTKYYWHVRAVNAGGTGAYSAFRWFKTTLRSPVLYAPVNDTVNVPLDPMLVWSAISGAAWYHLQVATDTAFAHIVLDNPAVTQTSIQLSGLSNLTLHYWRVRAANSEALSASSEIWHFTTILPAPQAVAVVVPADSAVILLDSIAFRWYAGTPQPDRYELIVAQDTGFTLVKADTVVTDTVVDITRLSYGHYWWKVRARNLAGWGPYSPIRTFTIVLENVDGETGLPTVYRLRQNYPNPFNPSTTIRYQLPRESRVLLEVYNVAGQRVRILVDEMQPAGYKAVHWNSDGQGGEPLPTGVYFYRLRASAVHGASSEFTDVRKMLLIK